MGAVVNEVNGRLLRKGDYIFGSFVKPEAVDGYINGVNPSERGDVLGRFPFSEASVDEAIDYAGVGYRVWRRMTINDRAGAVHRFRDQMAAHQCQFRSPADNTPDNFRSARAVSSFSLSKQAVLV